MRQQATRQPEDDPLDEIPQDERNDLPAAPSPTPPIPKIPPRPLDWPPEEGLDLPKTR